MSGFKEPGFTDRQKAALQAKRHLLDKFRAQPGPDDPEVLKRRTERDACPSSSFGWRVACTDQVVSKLLQVNMKLGFHLGLEPVSANDSVQPRLWLFDDAGKN